MTRQTMFGLIAAVAVALTAGCTASNAPAGADTPAPAATAGSIPQRTKAQHADLGRQHKTAWDLYQALKAEAKGGQRLTPASVPDWSGVYSRPADKNFTFDPDQPAGALTTAK